MSPIRALPVLVALVLAVAGPCAAAVALPDTGLFAPVAAQLAAREARLATLPAGDAGRIPLLIATGRADDAAREARSLPPRGTANARFEAFVSIQDFTSAETAARSLSPDARGRALMYRWDVVRDASAALDQRIRMWMAAGAAPDFLAAGRLAYDLLDH